MPNSMSLRKVYKKSLYNNVQANNFKAFYKS